MVIFDEAIQTHHFKLIIMSHFQKVKFVYLFLFFSMVCIRNSWSQFREFKLSIKGDTINAVTMDGQRTGKWVIEVGDHRSEAGFVEEGVYKKGQKDGVWRRYNHQGDLLAMENFLAGEKAGLQQYFTFLGELEHEENWKAYDPEHPYDTILIYGTGSGEIIGTKVVKAEPYSVKDGEWRYYEEGTGRMLRKETWSNNNIVDPNAQVQKNTVPAYVKPKETPKTPEMLEWERKNRGKKVVDGRTGL